MIALDLARFAEAADAFAVRARPLHVKVAHVDLRGQYIRYPEELDACTRPAWDVPRPPPFVPMYEVAVPDVPVITKPPALWFKTRCDECACEWKYTLRQVTKETPSRVKCPACGDLDYHLGTPA